MVAVSLPHWLKVPLYDLGLAFWTGLGTKSIYLMISHSSSSLMFSYPMFSPYVILYILHMLHPVQAIRC